MLHMLHPGGVISYIAMEHGRQYRLFTIVEEAEMGHGTSQSALVSGDTMGLKGRFMVIQRE